MKRTPILLWSPPGCGKTEGVSATAPRLNRAYWCQVQSQEDPVDTSGVIVPDHTNQTSMRYVPQYWKAACAVPTLLFFDEVTTCDPSQFASMLRATDDSRVMCGMELHPETIVIAAANPPSMAAGAARELPAPVLSRFRHWTIGPEYAVAFMSGKPGLDERIYQALSYTPDPQRSKVMVRVTGAYLSRHMDAALATPEQIRQAVETQSPFATVRGWTRAAMERPDNPEDWCEWIGERWAAGFVTWLAAQDLPDPELILTGQEKRIPDRGDAVMATAGSIQVLLGDKPEETRLKHGMAWYHTAAKAGHAAECAVAMIALAKAVGHIRFSRYPAEMAPYAAMLRAAGTY